MVRDVYLSVALIRAGLPVQAPKPGPDILLELPNSPRIWIEATCASPGAEGLADSVPPPQYAKVGEPPIVSSRPTSQMALRIRNAVSTKEAVFRNYLQNGIVAATDVMVVAINVHAVYGLWADMPELMMRSLYGVGDQVVTISRDTNKIVSSHREQVTHISKKSTGAEVGVQPFIDGSMAHISGVIGSRVDAVNLPHPRLGDDLVFLPNLTGSVAWPSGIIRLGEEWTFTPKADGWDGQQLVHVPTQ